MLGGMASSASQWKTFQRFCKSTENLVFNEAPKLIRQLQNRRPCSAASSRASGSAWTPLPARADNPTPALPAGRPVTSDSVPTAHRARRVAYAPDLDGRADPGEIVWTWVVYEDDPTRGKDRPVLVVGRDRQRPAGPDAVQPGPPPRRPDWVGIGSGGWDYEGRASWVRLDRVLDVPEEGIRREGAILEREMFDIVAARLRAEYSWSLTPREQTQSGASERRSVPISRLLGNGVVPQLGGISALGDVGLQVLAVRARAPPSGS